MLAVPQVILTRTAEIATLGFKVQELTTELNKLKTSQQNDATTASPTPKVMCMPTTNQ